jgi:predicted PurR-regulated permease PerM
MAEDSIKKDIKTIRNILVYISGLIIIYLLFLLKTLLIPFVLALFVTLLLHPVLLWLIKKKVPFIASVTLIMISVMAVIFGVGVIIFKSVESIYSQKDFLLTQIDIRYLELISMINRTFETSIPNEGIISVINPDQIGEYLLHQSGYLASSFGNFSGMAVLWIIYLGILMSGIIRYESYFKYLESHQEKPRLLMAFNQVKNSIIVYMRVKFVMSLLTGIGTGLVSWMFGLEFAFFFGFMAFVLNFIPTVGSIAGVVLPSIMGFIQIDSLGIVALLIVVLFLVQTLFGNILEPVYMGNSVSINTIVIIMGLLFWGSIWGIPGMFIAVPLMVLTKVILSRIEGAETLVKLLSKTD